MIFTIETLGELYRASNRPVSGAGLRDLLDKLCDEIDEKCVLLPTLLDKRPLKPDEVIVWYSFAEGEDQLDEFTICRAEGIILFDAGGIEMDIETDHMPSGAREYSVSGFECDCEHVPDEVAAKYETPLAYRHKNGVLVEMNSKTRPVKGVEEVYELILNDEVRWEA